MRMISYNEASAYMKWSPKDRDELYSVVDQATRYVENYLNYPLDYEEHTDYETIYRGIDGYICKCLPVQSISDIKINGTSINGYRVTSYGFDYDLKRDDKLEVTYEAGYKPFNYTLNTDTTYEAGKTYCKKEGDEYIEVYDYNIGDPIVDELYIQEINKGSDGIGAFYALSLGDPDIDQTAFKSMKFSVI